MGELCKGKWRVGSFAPNVKEVESHNIDVRISGVEVRVGDIFDTRVGVPINKEMLSSRLTQRSYFVGKARRPRTLFLSGIANKVSLPYSVHFRAETKHRILETDGDKVRAEFSGVGVEVSGRTRLLPTQWVTYVFEAVGNQVHLQHELTTLRLFCNPRAVPVLRPSDPRMCPLVPRRR